MQDNYTSKSHVTDNGQILLVGDVASLLCSAQAVHDLKYKHCDNILEAVTLVAEQKFSAIVIAMPSLDENPEPALKTLKQVNANSRIILLAQMHQEPAAMELVQAKAGRMKFADDYLICPVESKRFSQAVVDNIIKAAVLSEQGFDKTCSKDELISKLEELATEDDLTKLKNRRYVREFLRQIIHRAGKENLQATLLVFDIDEFKHYNDEYGHAVGDSVLKQVAAIMQRCCRKHDVVGRVGGDEFAVIFWDCPTDQEKDSTSVQKDTQSDRRLVRAEHPSEAIIIAERFRKALVSTEFSLLGPEGKGVLTISGGLARFPQHGGDVEEMFEQADKALLEAKRSGKNRIYLVGSPQGDIANSQ